MAGCWNTRLDIKGTRTTQRLCWLILQMSLLPIIGINFIFKYYDDWSVLCGDGCGVLCLHALLHSYHWCSDIVILNGVYKICWHSAVMWCDCHGFYVYCGFKNSKIWSLRLFLFSVYAQTCNCDDNNSCWLYTIEHCHPNKMHPPFCFSADNIWKWTWKNVKSVEWSCMNDAELKWKLKKLDSKRWNGCLKISEY